MRKRYKSVGSVQQLLPFVWFYPLPGSWGKEPGKPQLDAFFFRMPVKKSCCFQLFGQKHSSARPGGVV